MSSDLALQPVPSSHDVSILILIVSSLNRLVATHSKLSMLAEVFSSGAARGLEYLSSAEPMMPKLKKCVFLEDG